MTRREYLRIMRKVNVTGGCWIWLGCRITDWRKVKTYGNCRYRKQSILVHKLLYTTLRGIVPLGLELDHTCQNTACVNPDHLEPVSHLENMQRGKLCVLRTPKTHCPKGHEYTLENTFHETNVNGTMVYRCRICQRANSQRYKAAKYAYTSR